MHQNFVGKAQSIVYTFIKHMCSVLQIPWNCHFIPANNKPPLLALWLTGLSWLQVDTAPVPLPVLRAPCLADGPVLLETVGTSLVLVNPVQGAPMNSVPASTVKHTSRN